MNFALNDLDYLDYLTSLFFILMKGDSLFLHFLLRLMIFLIALHIGLSYPAIHLLKMETSFLSFMMLLKQMQLFGSHYFTAKCEIFQLQHSESFTVSFK